MIEAFAGESYGKRAGNRAIKLTSQRDHGSRRELVRESVRAFRRANFHAANVSGLSIAAIGRGGIHKNHGLAAADSFREFRRELMDAEKLNCGVGEFALEFIGSAPREPVVAA